MWTDFLDKYGIGYCMFTQLPSKLTGFGLSMCNQRFLTERIAHQAKERGLVIIWSSEMMWHHPGEFEAVEQGVIDKVLYVSEFQKKTLSAGYRDLPSAITGNYIDPSFFPFKERRNETFTVGRLSRPDPAKYPEDFPVFYEKLRLPDTRFRVMAWSEKLHHKYRWHRFDQRWDLLAPEQESQVDFLQTLDLFVYPLGHTFRESWGRSTVEAMLTGCIPLVPTGHHFENLLVHGKSGFICHDFVEWKEYVSNLYYDNGLRKCMARQCRIHAERELCNRELHLQIWMDVFEASNPRNDNPAEARACATL